MERLPTSKVLARREYAAAYRKANPSPRAKDLIIGIDGEGQGRKNADGTGGHVYNYVAAADENGRVWEVGSDPNKPVSTEDFLNFILDLPVKSLTFFFAGLYDLAKGLQDLPDALLFLLFREDRRAKIFQGDDGPEVRYRPIRWRGFRINYMHRRFSVEKGKRRKVVWDIFAFFQSKFTKACVDWGVGGKAEIEAMERMKERRGSFDAQSFEEIKAYCQKECHFLANLGRQLLTAHLDAGFELESYFGAGSTASALMKKNGVREFIGAVPDAMKEPIACAFFGGRFENSFIGEIRRPVWNADIGSAYPYAATFMPCLIHGRWKFRKSGLEREIERARLALIQWHLPRLSLSAGGSDRLSSWGPLPVRKANGTIAFPLGASSGWTWKEEFLAARNLRPDVIATGAWLYTSDCQCQPFGFLPGVYLERLRLGEDASGLVMKSGSNSIFGKTVQSVGIEPPFQCWVWGSNITSTCRAQLLTGMSLAPSLTDVIMLATDGLWSTVKIDLPEPRDTGTNEAKTITKGRKGPLGGWDVKVYERGVFAARPGIYFPLDPTAGDLEKVRARGLGRRVLYEQHRVVQDAFRTGQDSVCLGAAYSDVATRETRPANQRFVGAKTGMSFTPGKGVRRDPNYGEWVDWTTDVTFDPKPKRERIREDGSLKCWDWFEAPSLPYEKALKDPESALLELAAIIAEEQPNAEFSEYEIGEVIE